MIRLSTRPGHTIGTDCFISELASVDNDELHLGDRSHIAAEVLGYRPRGVHRPEAAAPLV